jgi:hypothetical protein
MLCGYTDIHGDTFVANGLKGFDYRGHFYGLGSGAEYDQKFPSLAGRPCHFCGMRQLRILVKRKYCFIF